jgi:hypothetical protein
MVDGTVVATTRTGASESSRETSCVRDVTVPTTSEEIPEWVILSQEEELLASPDEEELLVSPEEEMELLASGDEEELPEFNSIEDLRQWLGL